MTTPKRNTIRVQILGEEYHLRTQASAADTEAVARYVDAVVREVVHAGTAVETRKAAILACLRLAGELFQARAAAESLAAELEALSRDIRPWLPPSKRHD